MTPELYRLASNPAVRRACKGADVPPLPHATYPGHPLVLATYALVVFEDLDEALAPDEQHGWSATVRSGAIPGSGASAHEASRLLEMVRAGAAPEQVAELADAYWTRTIRGQAPTFSQALGPGLREARSVRRRFVRLAKRAQATGAHTPPCGTSPPQA